jgi:hypothetical protein
MGKIHRKYWLPSLRIERDNAAGDSSLHTSASPSLMQDVTPYDNPIKLPRYKISSDDYKYCTTKEGVKRIASALLPYTNSQTKDGSLFRVGLDTEFSSEGVHLIALAFDGGPKFIIHPYDWGFSFERTMRDVLGLDCLIFLLFNAGSDVHKLVNQFKI